MTHVALPWFVAETYQKNVCRHLANVGDLPVRFAKVDLMSRDYVTHDLLEHSVFSISHRWGIGLYACHKSPYGISCTWSGLYKQLIYKPISIPKAKVIRL